MSPLGPEPSRSEQGFLSGSFKLPGEPFLEQLKALIPRVRSFCIGFMGLCSQLDDVVQDVLVEVIRCRASFSGRSLERWVWGIAKNVCRLKLRRASIRRTEPLPGEPEASSASDPARKAMTAELRRGLLKAFQKLSDDERVAVTLKYFKGLSTIQVAGEMERPVDTVKSILGRAREILRANLDGHAS